MIGFDYSNQLNTIHFNKWDIESMQNISSVDCNEHFTQNFDPYSNRHSPLIGCSVVTEQDSKIKCSDIGLSDNQVFTTGLENNLNNVIRLHDNLSSLSLECNNEFDTGKCYTFAFSQKWRNKNDK